VLKNQPGLREWEKMIIADLGIHLFDVVRFFFGEVRFVFCRTRQISTGIKGEDVATCLLETRSGVHCQVEMSWASQVAYDCFPQTLVSIEGTSGTIDLSKDFQLSVFRSDTGQKQIAVEIPKYIWVNPDYEVVHASIVACNLDMLDALKGIKNSENVGVKNLETLKLVEAAYESAERAGVVDMDSY
jgi:predicted dehydrogenase